MLHKKLMPLIVCLLVGLLLFSGFSALAQDKELEGEFTVWSVQEKDDEYEARKVAFEAFAEKYPGVELDLNLTMSDETFKSKLPSAYASGTAPDLHYSWAGGTMVKFAQEGFLMDMTELLTTPPLDKYIDKATLSVATYEGKYYAIPLQAWAGAFLVNKSIFEEAGLTPPPSNYQPSWQEFTHWIETIRAETDYAPISMPASRDAMWVPHFWYMSLVDRLSEDYYFKKTLNRVKGYSFTDQPFVEAASKLKSLVDMNAFQSGFRGDGYTAAVDRYFAGNAAMHYMGGWVTSSLEQANLETFEDTVNIRFPSIIEGYPQDTILAAIGVWYAANSRGNTEIVEEFLKFLITAEDNKYIKEIINTSGNLSALKGIQRDPEVTNRLTKSVSEKYANSGYSHRAWNTYGPQKWATTLLDGLELVLSGQQSPEDFAKSLEKSAQALEEDGSLPVPYWPEPGME